MVAIPVMIAYHALQGRIDGVVADMDKAVRDWIDAWESPAPALPAPPARITRSAPSVDGAADLQTAGV